jgi:hypothetical protein
MKRIQGAAALALRKISAMAFSDSPTSMDRMEVALISRHVMSVER